MNRSIAALFAAFAMTGVAQAQDVADEIDELEPAVDTAVEANFEQAEEQADEIDALEPAVPSAVLAQDVSRTQSGGQVMDRMELGRTEITGNQELPTVLYIVPWQKADPADLMGRPVNTLLDEVLAPIDREEFVRQVDYYGDLYGSDEDE
ncbi:MAG: hypothetical protein QNI99_19955 [Woeseiaceae bacterium]|nr:hypothetical protein [Woeseiaceae bacterium]